MGTATRRDSTRSSRSRSSRMSSAVRRPSMRIAEPDLDGLLGRFADAITLIRVSHRSLDALEVAFEEGFVLRRGLAALDAAYNELDLAIVAIQTRTPRITGDQGPPPATRRGHPLGYRSETLRRYPERPHGVNANGVSTSIQQGQSRYKSDIPPCLSTSGDGRKVKYRGEFGTNGGFQF